MISQYGNLYGEEISSIVDWGDKAKLEVTRNKADKAREFNSIEMHGDLVLKASLNEQGNVLINNEIDWYDTVATVDKEFVVSRPKHWPSKGEHSSLVMTKVTGTPVYEFWPLLDAENRAFVLARAFDLMNKLHSLTFMDVATEIIIADVKKEAFEKLVKRYDEIKDVISSFGNISVVNGYELKFKDPYEVFEKLSNILVTHYRAYKTQYSLIHGDMQMSNTMIDPDTMKVSIIDPRGYFGSTKLYGLADYDIAKMLYSISGYDLFNYSHTFHISYLGRNELDFVMPSMDVTGCDEVLKSNCKPIHSIWLAVIWLGLAGYIKNDPVKSLCAHYSGMLLANQIFEDLEIH